MYEVPSTIFFLYPVSLLPIPTITLLLITDYFKTFDNGLGAKHKPLIYMHSRELHGEKVTMYPNCGCALVCVVNRHSACLVAW